MAGQTFEPDDEGLHATWQAFFAPAIGICPEIGPPPRTRMLSILLVLAVFFPSLCLCLAPRKIFL